MENSELRAEILGIFRKERQVPEAHFEESHFMDFLLEPPCKKGQIKNSFKGVRKYYDFIYAVELGLGICFTLSDQDRTYSLDAFIAKTKERIGKSRGNKMIIRERVAFRDNYYPEIALTLILLLLILMLKVHFITFLGGFCYASAMRWIIRGRVRERNRNKKLYAKIMGDSK